MASGSSDDPNDAAPAEPPSYNFSLSEQSSADLVREIARIPVDPAAERLPMVQLTGLAGQNAALMRLDHPVRIEAEGHLGDYAFAFLSQAEIRLTGNVGHGLAESMRSGTVRVRGNAGCGAGVAMTGGTLAIYGSAGPRCGAAMRGGGIFVRGDTGEETGVGALSGMIVIGGDAGPNLGDAMNNVTIFIRGRAESLAAGVTEAPLRKREQLRLGLLLINASIRADAKEFRRIVPEAMLAAEEAQRGEIVPNWR